MGEKKNRLLIIGVPFIVVLLILVAYQYGYQAVKNEISSLKDSQDIAAKTLKKYVALIAERPEVEKRLEELQEQRKADSSKIVEAQTPSIAAASLQETVKGIITGRGGAITSERVEKPSDMGKKFKTVNISIDATLPDTRALTEVLYGIETRTPYLVIREIDTRVRNFREPRELMVKMKISALMVGGK